LVCLRNISELLTYRSSVHIHHQKNVKCHFKFIRTVMTVVVPIKVKRYKILKCLHVTEHLPYKTLARNMRVCLKNDLTVEKRRRLLIFVWILVSLMALYHFWHCLSCGTLSLMALCRLWNCITSGTVSLVEL
jgi:hypothetical protein